MMNSDTEISSTDGDRSEQNFRKPGKFRSSLRRRSLVEASIGASFLAKVSGILSILMLVLAVQSISHSVRIYHVLAWASVTFLLVAVVLRSLGKAFAHEDLKGAFLSPFPWKLFLNSRLRVIVTRLKDRIQQFGEARSKFKGQYYLTLLKWLGAAIVLLMAWSVGGSSFSGSGGAAVPLFLVPVGIALLVALLAHLLPSVIIAAIVNRYGPWKAAVAISIPVGALTAIGFVFGGVKIIDLSVKGQLEPDAPIALLGSYSLVGGLTGLILGCVEVLVEVSRVDFVPSGEQVRNRIPSSLLPFLAPLCGLSVAAVAVVMAAGKLGILGDPKLLSMKIGQAYVERVSSAYKIDHPGAAQADLAKLSEEYLNALNYIAPSSRLAFWISLAILVIGGIYVIFILLWDLVSQVDVKSMRFPGFAQEVATQVPSDGDDGKAGTSSGDYEFEGVSGPQRALASEDRGTPSERSES